ncbi:MAG: type II secretion system F family protein [Actinomycetes bacterium]
MLAAAVIVRVLDARVLSLVVVNRSLSTLGAVAAAIVTVTAVVRVQTERCTRNRMTALKESPSRSVRLDHPRRSGHWQRSRFASDGEKTSLLVSSRRFVGGMARRVQWLHPRSDTEHAALLESVARSLRAGCSLVQALEACASASGSHRDATDLSGALRSVQAGVSLGDALLTWSSKDGDEARLLAGAALTLGAEIGGASAQSLDSAASGLRDRAALAREVRALTSQARASAFVMVAAPIAFISLGALADERIAHSAFFSPIGLSSMIGGIALDLAGAVWMARMTRRVT